METGARYRIEGDGRFRVDAALGASGGNFEYIPVRGANLSQYHIQEA